MQIIQQPPPPNPAQQSKTAVEQALAQKHTADAQLTQAKAAHQQAETAALPAKMQTEAAAQASL